MNDTSARASAPQALRVLLVDDDLFQLEHLKLLFQGLGVHDVRMAHSAPEGLAAYRHHAPDLIVCDLCMPQVDGLTFLRQLAMERCTADIVIVSGYNHTPPDDPHWPLAHYNGPVLHLAEKMAHLQGLRICATFEKPLTPEKALSILRCVQGAQPGTPHAPGA